MSLTGNREANGKNPVIYLAVAALTRRKPALFLHNKLPMIFCFGERNHGPKAVQYGLAVGPGLGPGDVINPAPLSVLSTSTGASCRQWCYLYPNPLHPLMVL